MRWVVCALSLLGTAVVTPAWGEPGAGEEQWATGFQATWVAQWKPGFNAPYSGPNSLTPDAEGSHSFTATGYFNWRPWNGGELHLDPEVASGHPLSGLAGLGGFTNGEIAKSVGESPTWYRARLYLRQTWEGDVGAPMETTAGENRTVGALARDRFVLSAGNLAVTDVFDNNRYAHDPRTQFLNWALMADAAYDYPADTRGYTWGIAGEYYHGPWTFRLGRFLLPATPNGLALDQSWPNHYGDQAEVEHAHNIGQREGRLRVLAFHTRAVLARYQDAIAAAGGGVPDLAAVRIRERDKYGAGLNLEQELAEGVGLFARAMWSDGKSETDAFTDADQSRAVGVELAGTFWRRGGDTAGLAFAENAISAEQRRYLSQGGRTFFVGDGALAYAPERIAEAYYAWRVAEHLTISVDLQRIADPGYNRARGPVSIESLRVHVAS